MAVASADPARRTTAKILIERLIAHGIDTLYCLPGVQNDPFFDALYDETNRLRPIHTRHEQGAAYLALGAAMATGKPAAYCVVPGPGFLNTTAALSQAYGNNAPVLADLRPGAARLCQSRHRLSARHSRSARHHAAADQMVGSHPRAARGRGPHRRGLPADAGRAAAAGGARMPARRVGQGDERWRCRACPRRCRRREPDDDAVAAAAKALGQSKRPLIIVGGGALDASSRGDRAGGDAGGARWSPIAWGTASSTAATS